MIVRLSSEALRMSLLVCHLWQVAMKFGIISMLPMGKMPSVIALPSNLWPIVTVTMSDGLLNNCPCQNIAHFYGENKKKSGVSLTRLCSLA